MAIGIRILWIEIGKMDLNNSELYLAYELILYGLRSGKRGMIFWIEIWQRRLEYCGLRYDKRD